MLVPAARIASITRQTLEAFVQTLIAEERYDDETGHSTFADGSPCATCTSAARHIARAFGGKVMGYWSAANPTAEIGSRYDDGHDFALIADRWVVDYFAYTTVNLLDAPVLDLHSAADRRLARRLLGNRKTWAVVPS